MKKLSSIILAIILIITPANLAFANNDNSNINISSKSAILMDVGSGQVLYEKKCS